jgi:hypothetical protein
VCRSEQGSSILHSTTGLAACWSRDNLYDSLFLLVVVVVEESAHPLPLSLSLSLSAAAAAFP